MRKRIIGVLERLGIKGVVRGWVLRIREKIYQCKDEEQKKKQLKAWYMKHTGENLDIDNPTNFNEKIQWLKIYDSTEMKTQLSDKYQVRDWVKDMIGGGYLVKLYGVWNDADKIDFANLPEQFVLKANHGSGMNIIVKNKDALDIDFVRKEAKKWLKLPYDLSGLEQQYYEIPRKIIAEEYIEQEDGNLCDYKIHCFNGEPKLIQVIGERDLQTHKAKEAYFDIDWNRNHLMYNTYDQYDEAPKKPEQLQDMLAIARTLCQDFIYVRVDLYIVKNKIKFGEMTFTPASGIGRWESNEANEKVGMWLNIEGKMKKN